LRGVLASENDDPEFAVPLCYRILSEVKSEDTKFTMDIDEKSFETQEIGCNMSEAEVLASIGRWISVSTPGLMFDDA